MNYQKVVIVVAISLLIIILSYIGYNLNLKQKNSRYPPVVSKCPDGWDISTNSVDFDLTDITSYSQLCQDMSACTADAANCLDPDYQYDFKDKNLCQKQSWAKNHIPELHWTGITDIDYGCP